MQLIHVVVMFISNVRFIGVTTCKRSITRSLDLLIGCRGRFSSKKNGLKISLAFISSRTADLAFCVLNFIAQCTKQFSIGLLGISVECI